MEPLEINGDHSSSDVTVSNTSPPRSCNHCVSHFMLFLVISLLIVSSVIAIVWTVINPQDPAFRLSSFSTSNTTVSNSRFAAEYDMLFNVNNTNKKANLVIDHVRVVVSYGKAIVSESVLEEIIIHVPKMSHQKLKVELGRDAARWIKNSVFKDISDESILTWKCFSEQNITFEFGIAKRNLFMLRA